MILLDTRYYLPSVLIDAEYMRGMHIRVAGAASIKADWREYLLVADHCSRIIYCYKKIQRWKAKWQLIFAADVLIE
jgi:hypothetical protein